MKKKSHSLFWFRFALVLSLLISLFGLGLAVYAAAQMSYMHPAGSIFVVVVMIFAVAVSCHFLFESYEKKE